jgi:hypothetical protein
MNSVDVEIARTVRREFGKRPVDATRLDIQVSQGRVSLGGILTTLRDQKAVVLKDEVTMVIKQLTRDRNIKEVQDQLRLIQTEIELDDHNSRGRVRPGR